MLRAKFRGRIANANERQIWDGKKWSMGQWSCGGAQALRCHISSRTHPVTRRGLARVLSRHFLNRAIIIDLSPYAVKTQRRDIADLWLYPIIFPVDAQQNSRCLLAQGFLCRWTCSPKPLRELCKRKGIHEFRVRFSALSDKDQRLHWYPLSLHLTPDLF